jgi:hypothetical protein
VYLNQKIMRTIKWTLGILLILLVTLYGVMFWWPRPADTTESRVFSADGANVDYCDLPELDGNGLTANEIPRAYTPSEPGCHYTTFPMPILEHCREPIAAGFPDMRGLWLSNDGYSGSEGVKGHLERIEQCGNRFVITSTGIIHDFHADGTLKNGARDTEGPSSNCANIWASIDVDESQVVNFHPFGLSSVTIVKRRMVGDELHWEYPKFDDVVKMKRLCKVPEAHRVYSPPE